MRHNSHYVVLFNMPADKRQIPLMSTQMFPENLQHLLRASEESIKITYGYQVVDQNPDILPTEHLKTQVFQDERVDKSQRTKSSYKRNGDEYKK